LLHLPQKYLPNLSLEAVIWISALTILSWINPTDGISTNSLCLFKNLGITFCPGCGLGRSIAYCLDGNLQQSLAMHPLGIITTLALSYRIIQLLFFTRKKSKFHHLIIHNNTHNHE